MKFACEAVQSGQISSRDAERQTGIPRRTIVNKIKKNHTKSVGHPTVLTDVEELKIVRVLQASSEFGCPLTKLDLKLLVHGYLKKNSRDHKFKNGIPGDAWVQGFLARNADELTVRTTQNISKARAEKGPQEIANYFNNLSTILKDISAENIVNLDETNLSDDPGSSKGIFRRGVKYPERVANSTKGNISLMFTATASGQCLPLYVVYKATNLYSEWITGGPPETRYNCTKSGWFDSAMFEDYFEKIILPWAQKTAGTKIVLCDNLSSHLSVKVVELCEQNNINFVFIPPRSTHLTQPLDVAFFAPLKKAWRKILYQYKLRNPNQTALNKKHFPKLLSELMEAIRLKEANTIKSGFRASGVFPLNPQEVLKKIPEMQEEILSYGIDRALMDYLKEIRAPKPMQVKRNKKVNCEPGKSVTVSDFNINSCKDALECNTKKKAKKKSSKNKNSGVAKVQRNYEKALFLDERTGLFGKTDQISNNDTKEDQDCYFEETQDQDCYLEETINNTSEYLTNSTPSLSKMCINVINTYLGQLVHNAPISSTSSHAFHNQTSVKNGPSKINILSNVIIKAGTQTTDVRFLNEISNTIEKMPFAIIHNSNFPECLKGKENKVLKKVKEEYAIASTSQPFLKGKKINRRDKVGNDLKVTKSARGHTSVKKRKKRSYSTSSSSSADIELFTADSDNSDYENYIAECLREVEEEEKEFLADIPFGLYDIEYFTENRGKIKVDDWIIVRFATKKSLKHFVGKVLSINDTKPTVKFVRKVKQSRCENGTTFTYPTVDDICTIQHLPDVISVLPEAKVTRRGQIIFNVNLNKFNVQ